MQHTSDTIEYRDDELDLQVYLEFPARSDPGAAQQVLRLLKDVYLGEATLL